LLWSFVQMTQPCWRKARKINKNTNERTVVGLSVFDSPLLKSTGRRTAPTCFLHLFRKKGKTIKKFRKNLQN